MINKTIKIGSRKSALALAQTEIVKNKIMKILEKCDIDMSVEIITFDTRGDSQLSQPLYQMVNKNIGDKGLFTLELEEALTVGDIHFAVHSLKDMPLEQSATLPIVAIPERNSAHDCLVLAEDCNSISLADLPVGSIIGTSSLRRISQLSHLYPHLQFIPLRGNVGTRLKKINEHQDGLIGGIFAEAGLARLGLDHIISERLLDIVPMAGQGAIAVQADGSIYEDEDLTRVLALLHDTRLEHTILAERRFLSLCGGGCHTPMGAYAIEDGDNIILQTYMADQGYQRYSLPLNLFARYELSDLQPIS